MNVYTYWEGDRPPIIELCLESLSRHIPTISIETPETIQGRDPEIWDFCQGLAIHERSDLLRYWLLSKTGGIWVDPDTLALAGFAPDFLKACETLNLVGVHFPNMRGWARDGIVGSPFGGRPGSPLLLNAYRQCHKLCTGIKTGKPVRYGRTSVAIIANVYRNHRKECQAFSHLVYHPVRWDNVAQTYGTICGESGDVVPPTLQFPGARMFHIGRDGHPEGIGPMGMKEGTTFLSYLIRKAFRETKTVTFEFGEPEEVSKLEEQGRLLPGTLPKEISSPRQRFNRFIRLSDLAADVHSFAEQLPPVAGIVGVSRSGMIPASMLSAYLHLPLWEVNLQTKKLNLLGHGPRLKSSAPGPLLVVDDSINKGTTLRWVRNILAVEAPNQDFIYSAIYCNPLSVKKVDLYKAANEPLPHLFEWNYCNGPIAGRSGWDFDGILCEDFAGTGLDESPVYLSHLENAKPRYLPRQRTIPLIVTARLEKYRELSLAWLARHGVSCASLVMGQWSDHKERSRHKMGEYKAKHYAASNLVIFVESDPRQAKEINQLTGRPVLCPITAQIFQ